MDVLKALLTGGGIDLLLPSLLMTLGMQLENKSANHSGSKYEAGKILVAFAPVIPALIHGDDKTVKRVLLAAYNTIGNFLGIGPAALPALPVLSSVGEVTTQTIT